MKTIKRYFAYFRFNFNVLFFLLILSSCAQNSEVKQAQILEKTSLNEIDETQTKIIEDESVDSIRLDLAMKDALEIAQKAVVKEDFLSTYSFQINDSSLVLEIEIQLGYLYSKAKKHCIIRRFDRSGKYFDVFLINDNKFEQLLQYNVGTFNGGEDFLQDVNGDGKKDYLIKWHPANGGCRADLYTVFLQNQVNGFEEVKYEFINPTFSAKEKIVRGIEYGRPGEIPLYKYQWNALKVDTLEYIFPIENSKNRFVKTKTWIENPTEKDGVFLSEIPDEYKEIESFAWFSAY